MENQTQVGRPTVIDEPTIAKLVEAFRLGASDILACSYAAINKATYYRHLKSDEDFATKMEQAKTYVDLTARAVVVRAIEGKDLKASQWWLERKSPDFAKDNKMNVAIGSSDSDLHKDLTREDIEERMVQILKDAGLQLVPTGEETKGVTVDLRTTS